MISTTIEAEPTNTVIYLAFYRFPEDGYHWEFIAPFEKRKAAKECCETHVFNEKHYGEWREADLLAYENPGHDYLDAKGGAGGLVVYQIREEVVR